MYSSAVRTNPNFHKSAASDAESAKESGPAAGLQVKCVCIYCRIDVSGVEYFRLPPPFCQSFFFFFFFNSRESALLRRVKAQRTALPQWLLHPGSEPLLQFRSLPAGGGGSKKFLYQTRLAKVLRLRFRSAHETRRVEKPGQKLYPSADNGAIFSSLLLRVNSARGAISRLHAVFPLQLRHKSNTAVFILGLSGNVCLKVLQQKNVVVPHQILVWTRQRFSI